MSSSDFGDQPDPGQFGPGQFSPGSFDAGQSGPAGQPGPGQYGPPGQFGQGPYGPQPGWQAPPYGPGPYVQMGAGWPQMAGRRTNPLAIAALCCSIGQLVAGPLAGIAAIVLGSISLKQIRTTGEDGRGMAITGLVLGIVGTVLVIFLIAVVIAIAHSATNLNGLNNNFGN